MSNTVKTPRWIEWLNSKSNDNKIVAVKVQQAR